MNALFLFLAIYNTWKISAKRGAKAKARVAAELHLVVSHSEHLFAVFAAGSQGPQPLWGNV